MSSFDGKGHISFEFGRVKDGHHEFGRVKDGHHGNKEMSILKLINLKTSLYMCD